MKKLSLLFSLVLFSFNAEAMPTIIACEPEWGDLAYEIAQDKVIVKVVANAEQNPSLIKVDRRVVGLFRKADMVFCAGGGLESNWLDLAIQRSHNPKIKDRQDVHLMAADYVEKQSELPKNGGDTSDKASPRIHLNPHNIIPIAAEFTRRMKILDPLNASFYQKSYENFARKWQSEIQTWEKAAQPLNGMRVVIHDDSWMELVNWLNLNVTLKIADRPEQNVRRGDLGLLVQNFRNSPANLIILGISENKEAAFFLSRKTRTKVVLLPMTVGRVSNAFNLFEMFSVIINTLLDNCAKTSCTQNFDLAQ